MRELLATLSRLAEDPSQNPAALATAVSIVVLAVIVVVLVMIGFALPQTSSGRSVSARVARRLRIPRWLSVTLVGLLSVSAALTAVALWYQGTSTNEYCTRTCHAMAVPTETWMLSAHKSVDCVRCHEGRPWESFPRGVTLRLSSLYSELTGAPARGGKVPPENCMSCHANVIEKPLEARNGETFLHGEVLTLDPSCVRCHGPQGHEPHKP